MTSRTRTFLAALAVATLPSVDAIAAAQSADEIIAKSLAAKGGVQKLRAVESVKTTGRIKTPRGDLPVTNWTKRPNLKRQEMTIEGATQVVAYDGTTLWGVNPKMGATPQVITGAMAERNRADADDFDSVLLDYKEKGTTIELVPAAAGTKSGPHLRVTRKNGSIQDVFLNPDTFLEERIATTVEQGGQKVVIATELLDYKSVDGVMVPFRIRQVVDGKPQGEVTYTQVQFNLPIGDELFKMPK